MKKTSSTKAAPTQINMAKNPLAENHSTKIILAYVPVLHAGYKQFFERHQDAEAIYVLGPELIADFDHLQKKDLRALLPELIYQALTNWSLKQKIVIATKENLRQLNKPETLVITAEEIELGQITKLHLPLAKVKTDNYFLRYDSQNSTKKNVVNPKTQITTDQFAGKIMTQAEELASKSADWWRQVGAIIIKNQQILLSGYNQHVPEPAGPYINGDPRSNFSKGTNIELSTAIHAEAGLIAQAAKQGLSLNESEIYVTTFPCPACAKLIAYSGIKTVYFLDGYSMLDGESVLKSQKVEIIKVEK